MKLKVTDGSGTVHESAMTQSVIKSCENKFETVCTGPKCLAGATSASGSDYTSSMKSGTNGVGLWCYRNTTSSEATVNLTVTGTTRGESIMTMVWTNGVTTEGATMPSEGRSSTGGGGGGRAPVGEKDLNDIAWQDYWDEEYYKNRWNWHHHEANAYLERQLLENPPSIDPAKERALLNQRQVVQSPSIGASKDWKDPTTEPWDGSKYPCMTNMRAGSGCPTYTTKLKHKCQLTDGREVLFWVDDASLVANGGLMSDAHITEWGKMFCSTGAGAKKGIDKLKSFNTDFWTTDPRGPGYIAGDGDGSLSSYNNSLQPINIVVVKPGRGNLGRVLLDSKPT